MYVALLNIKKVMLLFNTNLDKSIYHKQSCTMTEVASFVAMYHRPRYVISSTNVVVSIITAIRIEIGANHIRYSTCSSGNNWFEGTETYLSKM
jgi:hypothetical protein